jgi:exodeoxyribonuclease V beta subunit
VSAQDLSLSMPLDGLQLIEASAGTGKTWTLAGLHLRLVVERRRAVREILAVTFTDAATQELKSRLRARLAACVALADADVALAPAENDSAETRQAKRLIAAALASETREQLVRRLRIAALDIDHAPISTIHGFCRRALDEFGLLAGRTLAGELVASDKDLIATAAADYWRDKATSAPQDDFFALRDAFSNPETLAKLLAPLLPGTRRLLPEANGQPRAIALLHEALAQVRARIAETKRAIARHSHDDEIRELHDALIGTNGAELAARLHARFPVALIDEFQDTDAQQYAIFDAIYGKRGDLILIGDPKQAIYGFRGGDVHTYLRARSRVAEPQTLARNFRSSPAYLRALNALYANAGERAFAQAGIDYQPLEPGGTTADDDLLIDGKAAVPLTFWCDRDEALHRGNKEIAAGQLAAACASAIFDLLAPGRARLREKKDGMEPAHRPLQPAGIAVLVATHDEALEMQHALAARGIASASVTRRSVFASEEAGELHRLLDALADFDEARLRGALTTRLFGWTTKRFAACAATPRKWSEQLEAFAEWRRIWSAQGVAAMLARVFEKYAAALLRSSRGERRMTNWLQLAELAQIASNDCVGLRGLVDWLAARIAHADDDNEDEQLRLESDAGRVKIYTFHKSKGLQFPLVFLPFAGMRRSAGNRYPRNYRYRDDEGNAALYVAADGEAAAAPAAVAARQAALRDDLAERLRILYVALTRACCAAFVACDPIGSGEPPALLHLLGADGAESEQAKKTKAADELSALLAQCLATVRVKATGTVAIETLPPSATTRMASSSATATAGAAREMPRAVRDDWRIVSYSRLASGAREETRADRDDEGVPAVVETAAASPPGMLAGARFGTAFHELIELADFAAWRDWHGRAMPNGQSELIERIVRRHALDADPAQARALLADLLARTLNAPLPFGACLADLAPGEFRAEMPFHFALGSIDTARWIALLHEHGYVAERRRFDIARLEGLMTGVLDLVVSRAGRWWVVDYKTNLLHPTMASERESSLNTFARGEQKSRPYAPAALAAAVRDKEYDLQYLIYLTALHRWLKSRDPHYDYARDIGGALYLFVRGLDADGTDGVHFDKPPAQLIEAIDTLLAPTAGAAA